MRIETRKLRIFPIRALVATAVVLSASCAIQEKGNSEINLNKHQAEERIEEYITQAVADLPGDVELSIVRKPAYPPCESSPGDENHAVTVRHIYWIDGIPKGKNEEAVEVLHTYWSTGNWEVTRDGRPEEFEIEARNRDDNFRMNLVINKNGRPSLAAYSPCVQDNENM